MLKVGGYILPFDEAVVWARRRFPGIDIYNEVLILNIIQGHNNKDLGGKMTTLATYKGGEALCIFVMHSKDDPNAWYNDQLGGNLECISTFEFNKRRCVFLTHCEDDPTATPDRFYPFLEDDYAVVVKQIVFLHKEDSDETLFMTLCDPFKRGY
ncbi:hypothetical protein E4T56_gene1534 [Termitomyces sp. T112]|nr:hypothetical protein E4T56_gene1534 [Termitomyces sp. T112]